MDGAYYILFSLCLVVLTLSLLSPLGSDSGGAGDDREAGVAEMGKDHGNVDTRADLQFRL